MTGYRRAYGRSRMPRRYVPWSEKGILTGAVQEKGPSRGESGTRGFSSESKTNLRSPWFGTPHGIVFSRSFRRVPKEDSGECMLFNSIRGAPWEPQPGAEGGVVTRVKLDVQDAIPETQAPPSTVGEQLPRRVYIRRSVELAGKIWVHRQMYRVPACEIGIEAGGSQ